VRRLPALVAALQLAGAVGAATLPSDLAPDVARADLDGAPVHLPDYRGKVVLVNFWATWCGPCLEEIPTFVAWQREFGAANLQIIGISMDDDAAPVRRFVKKTPLDYPVVIGDAALARQYGGVLGLPATFLVDARGAIVSHHIGETNLKALHAEIAALVAQRQH
jgi:thiol-disulfide isomerase/thioredoxin